MDPMTASLLLNAGGLAAQHLMGAGRPKYEIPASARQALAKARILEADQNMPGEQKALEQVGISSANAVRAAQESGNALESIAAIQGQGDRGVQNVLSRSEADQRADQERLMQQLSAMAQYEDQAYQMNEFAPYAERQQETRDIFGAMASNLGLEAQRQDILSAMKGGSELPLASPQNPPTQVGNTVARQSAPSLLPQPGLKPITSVGGTLPQITPVVTPNADTEATEFDRIRVLLELLKKSPQPYPY